MTSIKEFNGDYYFLSNFYLAEVEWDGVRWPTSEHAYQAAKTTDVASRDIIRRMPTPGAAKKAGKLVALRPDWEEVKVSIMVEVLRSKFSLHKDLRDQLLTTGDAYLEEGNWWRDQFWGVCPVGSGNGKNMLGKLLMELRAEWATTTTQE